MKKPIVVFCALTCLAFGANSAQAQDAQTETLPTEDANTLADKAYRMVEVKGNSWKNLQDAIAIYESIENATELDDKRKVRTLIDLSRAYLRLADKGGKKSVRIKTYQKGIAAAKRAQAINPKHADAVFWEAANMAMVGKTRGVMNSLFMVGDLKKKLNQSLALDPGHSYARNTLADVLHALPGLAGGSDKKAEKLYLETIKRAPRFSPVYYDLGVFYTDVGRKDEARKVFNQCIAMSNSSVKNDWRKFDKRDCQNALNELDK